MAKFGTVEALTATAVADLTGKQFHVLRHAGARLVNQASNAASSFTLGIVGVLQNKPNSGQAATVGYSGRSKVVAGAAVTAGRLLTTNSSGRAINATSGQLVFGRALDAAGANGEVITALLMPTVRLSGAI